MHHCFYFNQNGCRKYIRTSLLEIFQIFATYSEDGTKIQNLPASTKNLEDPTKTKNLMLIENSCIKIGLTDLEQITKILD
jgi:hypothetical protein